MSFYTKAQDGTRQYFNERQIKEANIAAQAQANETGEVAYRYDDRGGKSMFLPGYVYNAARAVMTSIKGYKNPKVVSA